MKFYSYFQYLTLKVCLNEYFLNHLYKSFRIVTALNDQRMAIGKKTSE